MKMPQHMGNKKNPLSCKHGVTKTEAVAGVLNTEVFKFGVIHLKIICVDLLIQLKIMELPSVVFYV